MGFNCYSSLFIPASGLNLQWDSCQYPPLGPQFCDEVAIKEYEGDDL